MSIACLGWGSLIWNPRELPIATTWRHDGPELPVEFVRQSKDGRITLVIEPKAKPLRVFSAVLKAQDIDAACKELADREGVSCKNISNSIGHWSTASTSQHDEVDVVKKWAWENGYTGVVWTALKPKFNGATNQTPSSDQVIEYLKSLSGTKQDEAEEYIRKAPKEIRTAYRDRIEKELGWTPV